MKTRKPNLTPEQYQELEGVVNRTFQMVAGDLNEAVQAGEKMPRSSELIDSCLDLAFGYAGHQGDPYGMSVELRNALLKANGTTVRRTLGRTLKLGF